MAEYGFPMISEDTNGSFVQVNIPFHLGFLHSSKKISLICLTSTSF